MDVKFSELAVAGLRQLFKEEWRRVSVQKISHGCFEPILDAMRSVAVKAIWRTFGCDRSLQGSNFLCSSRSATRSSDAVIVWSISRAGAGDAPTEYTG
ncbi:MAG: hypothetical protein IRZ09_08315 [Variibacter sp.]|nr:hypothetical protein [Variibacter sp.]